jgi:hypothetical protein
MFIVQPNGFVWPMFGLLIKEQNRSEKSLTMVCLSKVEEREQERKQYKLQEGRGQ